MQKKDVQIIIAAILFFVSGTVGNLNAQTLKEAQNFAFNGQRKEARNLCRIILSKQFDSDVALLMGRTYAWDSKYDSARFYMNEVLIRDPENLDALSAITDVEYWSDNYNRALEFCNRALQIDSISEDFVLKKARILYSSEKIQEAVDVLQIFLNRNPANAEALKKLKEYRFDLLKNTVRLNYTLDVFDDAFNRDPWQITALSYTRKTPIGSVIARVNYAKRFGSTGFQYEIDAYPKFTENSYFYVNYGFSQNSLFPKNRYGLEWYHNFPNAYEGSVGVRLLSFANSNVDIYTATFGKYIGNYWLSLRSFVTPGTDGTSVSGFLLARRYFSDPENYLGLRLAYGISPDENRNLINSTQRLNLKARSARLEFNHIFNNVWIINIGGVLGSEERVPDSFSGYYTLDISISRLF